jgi:hypothetical protein
MLLTKQDITELPHDKICAMTQTELDHFATTTLSKRCGSWLLPQLVAQFGSWTLVKEDGVIDVVQTLKYNCENSSQNTCYWKLTRINRSLLVVKQTAQPEYGTLTPLILAGFKRMQGVPYETWRGLPHLEYVLEPRLLEAVCVDNLPNLGSERLLEIRQQGLTTRSGAKAGQLKSPEATWSLTGIADTELGHLPKLTITMLTQIWLAHPSLRSSMMIVDPQNWDQMPEPLIANNVFKTPEPQEIAPLEKKAKETDRTLLPWM